MSLPRSIEHARGFTRRAGEFAGLSARPPQPGSGGLAGGFVNRGQRGTVDGGGADAGDERRDEELPAAEASVGLVADRRGWGEAVFQNKKPCLLLAGGKIALVGGKTRWLAVKWRWQSYLRARRRGP